MADPPKDNKFMREKVVKPKTDWKRLLRRAVLLVLGAVVFGIIAAVTFVVSRPVIESYFPEETTAEQPTMTIERDPEPETLGEFEPEYEIEAETEPAVTGIDPEDLEEAVVKSVNDYLGELSWSPESIAGFYDAVGGISREADLSVVEISSVRLDTDLFDNPIENTGDYAGIIVAINPREALILVPDSAVAQADELSVTFSDGESAPGEVLERDSVAHVAVIRALTADIPESTLNLIEAVELGNSYLVNAGEPVVAVGSPAGYVRSVGFGTVSYIATGVQIADGQTRVFCMNDVLDADKGTFILNLSGELIGWATDIFESGDTPDRTMIMSISDYKGILQKLTNGTEAPYIGIIGQDVTASMQEEGIPAGVYISESIAEGPAYRAGIQNGDILTMIGEKKTTSIRDVQDYLEDTKVSDVVSVTIVRKGIDDYKEIEYEVTIGAR